MLLTLIRAMRVISLAILCAGSAGFVYAAMASVTAASKAGVPIAQAAAQNAPVFVEYSKTALVLSIFVVFVEFLDFVFEHKLNFAKKLRYATSAACLIAATILTLGIVPRMVDLLPDITTKEEAHAAFQQLHNQSRLLVGALILFSFASIAIPLGYGFYELRQEEKEEKKLEGKIAESSEDKTEATTEEGSKSS
jgi:hypothetical protein